MTIPVKIPNRAPRQVLWEPKIGLPLIVLPESIGFAKDLKMPAFFDRGGVILQT